MRKFGAEGKRRDTGLICGTGHGVEHDGKVYLPPGDYLLRAWPCARCSTGAP
jgi:hypothetical protein